MNSIVDVVETEDGEILTILIGLNCDPHPHNPIVVFAQVISQNGHLSNIGGWIVNYLQSIDEPLLLEKYIEDMKSLISLFLNGDRQNWTEPQPGTFRSNGTFCITPM